MAILEKILSFNFVVDSCKDTPEQIMRYQKKISGPLMDRIDLHLEVPAVDINDLRHKNKSVEETSAQVRTRVAKVREVQLDRQGCFNSALSSRKLESLCELDVLGEKLIDNAVANLGLSARSYHRILRVARTVADMGLSQTIEAKHLAEALSYRSMQKAFS